MRAFEYTSPKTVSEAADLLAEKGELARVLAGGTDLIVQVREGKRHVERIVDIKDIPETNVLSYEPQTGLHLGSAVPCYKIYGDKAISATYPALADSTNIIGGTAIQGRAAVGGNLCNASPAADTIPALIVLGSELHHCRYERNARSTCRAVLHCPGHNRTAEWRISGIPENSRAKEQFEFLLPSFYPTQ